MLVTVEFRDNDYGGAHYRVEADEDSQIRDGKYDLVPFGVIDRIKNEIDSLFMAIIEHRGRE